MSEKIKLYLYPLLAAFFAAIAVYGFELTHFTMSIDEEFMDNFYQTVALGRWGHSFLREYILPEPFAPFFTTLVSISFLALSASLTARIANLNIEWSCVMAILYISIPQFAYQLEFANQSDTVAIATLSSTLSVMFFIRGTISLLSTWSLISIISYAVAISVYQSFTILPVTLCLMYVCFALIGGNLNNRGAIIVIIKFAMISISATILYAISTYIIQNAFDIHGGSYLSNMIKWGKEDNISVLNSVYLSVKGYFTFNTFFGLDIYAATIVALIVFVISSLVKRNFRFFTVTAIILMILSPFIMIAGIGGNQPPRTMASLSPAFSAIILISLMSISVRWITISLTSCVMLIGSANSSRLFYSDYMSLQSDLLLANRIVTTINVLSPEFDEKTTPVYFYGRKKLENPWRVKNGDVFGNSFFAWDGGNNKRILAFMRVNGVANMKKIDKDLVPIARKYAEQMPLWPNPESIQMKDGMLIIKLGSEVGID
ncbi:glucosyltransferase domain-containing protein [Escherichia coli]|nr:glucosyltransferase domain-containing protein [Escherichia coli]MBI0983008.1 hypothetical protein [Escherichia coli]